MLRANVTLSRKLSRDYQSSGYSVTLDGEVGNSHDDPKVIQDAIDRLYRLAEDALAREIDRDQSEGAIGRHDEKPPQQNGSYKKPADNVPRQGQNHDQGNGQNSNGSDETATNKQVQFMLSAGKRQGLSKAQVEDRIQEIIGKRLTVYQLTKREASKVIDHLMQGAPVNGRR